MHRKRPHNKESSSPINQWASLVAQMVKLLPAMQETQVQSLGWEDPLEKEIATRSSTLACKIPWTEEPGRLQSMGSQRVRHDWAASRISIEPRLRNYAMKRWHKGVKEMVEWLSILTMTVVTQMSACVKIHRTQGRVRFQCMTIFKIKWIKNVIAPEL